jgi:hypothetical protein
MNSRTARFVEPEVFENDMTLVLVRARRCGVFEKGNELRICWPLNNMC